MPLPNWKRIALGALAGLLSPLIQPVARFYHQGKSPNAAGRRRWPLLGGQLADLYVFWNIFWFFYAPSVAGLHLPAVAYLVLSLPLIVGSVQGMVQSYRLFHQNPELSGFNFCQDLWGLRKAPEACTTSLTLKPYHEAKTWQDGFTAGLLGSLSACVVAPLTPVVQYSRQIIDADYSSPQFLSDFTVTWAVFRGVWFLHGLSQFDYRCLGLIPGSLAIYGGIRGCIQGYRSGLSVHELSDFAEHFLEGGFCMYQRKVPVISAPELSLKMSHATSLALNEQLEEGPEASVGLEIDLEINGRSRRILRFSTPDLFFPDGDWDHSRVIHSAPKPG